MMTVTDGRDVRRVGPWARRLERRGFHLAKQCLSPGLVERARGDAALCVAVKTYQELFKTHVFHDREARDAACRVPMLDGAFELVPTSARDLAAVPDLGLPPAVGPGLRDPGFSRVVEAVADPEIEVVLTRSRRRIVTIAGVHYSLRPQGPIAVMVEAKAPFDAADEDEVRETASWLGLRALARRRRGRPGTH